MVRNPKDRFSRDMAQITASPLCIWQGKNKLMGAHWHGGYEFLMGSLDLRAWSELLRQNIYMDSVYRNFDLENLSNISL